MKKAIIAVLAAGTALFSLSGCGSEFVGEWECTMIKDGDRTVKAKDFEEYRDYSISEYFQIEFEKDGSGTISYQLWEDEKGSVDFEWTEDDGKVTMKFDDEDDELNTKKLKGKIKDDELVVTGFGEDDLSVYLEKEED